MPELPEVETVCRGLRQTVLGKVIKSVDILRPAIRIPIPADLADRVEDGRIKQVSRRAKYILIHLDNHEVLIVHLGMSGRLMVSKNSQPLEKHDHVVFKLNDGQVVTFNDPRRFGLITLDRTETVDENPLFAEMGPEPLEPSFNANYLRDRLSGRKTAIKILLMDQRIVVGVGNIYASEALFDAGIFPTKAACDLKPKQLGKLVESIRKVLNAAIDSGGSTLRNYVDSKGESGYFQHRFLVYDKEGEPCARCKRPIERIVQSGRSTFFCGKCQK